MQRPQASRRNLVISSTTLLALLLAFNWTHAQEIPTGPPRQSRVGEIHEACNRAGIQVRSVRQKENGDYEIHCVAEDYEEACVIMRQVLATPAPGQTPVTTLQDALVVLRYEPHNRLAHRLIRDRYDALRAEHLKTLKKQQKKR